MGEAMLMGQSGGRLINGIKWHKKTFNGVVSEYTLTYGRGTWVCSNATDGIMYSTDNGVTWTQSNLTSSVGAIHYYQGYFYAANSVCYRSSDGITWFQLGNCSFSNDYYYFITLENKILFGWNFSSDNGATWTHIATPSNELHPAYVAPNGVWFAERTSGSSGTYCVYSSVDGISWSAQTNFGTYFSKVCGYLNGKMFIAADESPNSGVFYYSDNGTWTTWHRVNLAVLSSTFVANIAGYRCYAYCTTSSKMHTSLDGVNWTVTTGLPSGGVVDVQYNDGRFVAIYNKKVYWSLDGINFTVCSITLGIGGRYYSYNGGLWLCGNHCTNDFTHWKLMLDIDGGAVAPSRRIYGNGVWMATEAYADYVQISNGYHI